jgi:hypothetical protein
MLSKQVRDEGHVLALVTWPSRVRCGALLSLLFSPVFLRLVFLSGCCGEVVPSSTISGVVIPAWHLLNSEFMG